MLSWIREKFGTVVIGGIITFIGFVFVFYGVFSPKSTRGMHEGAVAGKVNGDSISLGEFQREFNRRLEFFKNMMGGKVNEEQLKGFHVREMVFRELAQRKLMVQEAYKTGLTAGDEQVKEMIREIPAFQKDGHFDVLTYKQVLEANQHTPGGFERLIREDASAQAWNHYFLRRSFVSADEVRRQFVANEDQRKFKYVLLTPEAGRKTISIDEAAVKAYLGNTAKLNLVKSRYEAGKETVYKGKTFEASQQLIARDLLANEKYEEVQKNNDLLAEQIKGILTAEHSSDAKVNALLKPVGLEVKTTEWVGSQSPYVQGMGEVSALLRDAFGKAGVSTPKRYSSAGGILVAVVVEAKHPDFAKFDEQRSQLMEQITSRKSREMLSAWIQDVTKKAKIEPNPSVATSEEG